MKILVTGAAGFLGSRLVKALLSDSSADRRATEIVAADSLPCPVPDPRIRNRIGTIEDPAFVRSLVDADVRQVFHLAAVLSGGAEAEFDAGMRVNVDGTRALLEACRALGTSPRFVFSSTVAVFGGDLPPIVPEDLALTPQTSYGTEKAIAELLVASTRDPVRGRRRLPARLRHRPAGQAQLGAVPFASGIIRDSAAGIEAVAPFRSTRHQVTSPGAVTQGLVHAARVDTASLRARRALNLPD
jgi:uncharacterized protein YbjT (DUF2867 family)